MQGVRCEFVHFAAEKGAVHGATCEILLESDAQRVIGVAWDSSSPPPPRAVEVEVECTDAPGMLASMSRAIGSVGVNIGGVVLKKLIAGTGLARFEVFVSTMEEMQKVISALESETGVLRVARGALSGRKDAKRRTIKASVDAKRRTIKASVVPSNLMSDM
ncbi:hypothetical protein T484DRAFT_1816658 [Baffinella frigidus]|nr:hypothetical protein T484DRAFT_1816658 [Cryptophyta sp. CCMP2293]